jgi:Cu2+-exporting ATPase
MLKQPHYEVVHRLPGRWRVRLFEILRQPELAFSLEDVLSCCAGVHAVRANADCASVTITFDAEQFDPQQFLATLDLAVLAPSRRRRALPQKQSGLLSYLRHQTFVFEAKLPPKAQCLLSTAALVLTVVEAPPALTALFLWSSIAPIVNRAVQTALDEKRLGADLLDGCTCMLLARQGRFFPAAMMTFLISLGELLRDVITRRCQSLISYQMALSRHAVWLARDHKRTRTPVGQLRTGDRIVVYAGELLACQGKVASGHGTIVAATPDADFEPRFVQKGDSITGNEVLLDGKLYLTYEGERLLKPDPVREKQKRRWLQRTQLHRIALRAGHRSIGPLLALAALVLALTKDLNRALPIICFDFITGVRITIPVAVLSSMCKAGTRGIVVRNAAAMELLSNIDVVIFARSGTLTSLRPFVTEVFVCNGYSLEQVMRMAAAAEQRFNHVAAYAIYRYAKLNTIPVPERETASVIGGLGVKGIVEGHSVLVGNTRFMDVAEVDVSEARNFLDTCKGRGDSRVCVTIDGKLAGVIAYQDPIRPEAHQVIAQLKRMGIKEVAMMTGGNALAAQEFAQKLGITAVHSRALPEDQAQVVQMYKHKGHKVAVVGYDVDDSLALEQADLAIALNVGTDVTRFRADVVLTSETLMGLVEGITISREAMSLARQNLALVSVPNGLGLFISVVNQTDYLSATLLNNGSVVFGALNGLRPLRE